MVNVYVAVDITGRLSDDGSFDKVMEWMNKENLESGDCIVWEKSYKELPTVMTNLIGDRIAAIRSQGQWIILLPV